MSIDVKENASYLWDAKTEREAELYDALKGAMRTMYFAGCALADGPHDSTELAELGKAVKFHCGSIMATFTRWFGEKRCLQILAALEYEQREDLN